MIKLTTNILGSFVLKDNGIILEKILFKRETEGDIKKITEKLDSISKGETIPEEEKLVEKLKSTANREIFVDNPLRFHHTSHSLGVKFKKYDFEYQESVFDLGSQIGIGRKEILELTKKVNFNLTKKKLKTEITKDKVLIQAINTLDELEEINNLMMEHLREWNMLAFPELENIIKKPEVYAQVVSQNFDGLDSSILKTIEEKRKASIGMELSPVDEEAIKKYSQGILNLYETEKELESYISVLTKEIAPNLSALIGPLLSSRLISLSGSLEKLAMMPSSTVQILGAEGAFFKFLKTGNRPPKHGIIFNMPEIRNARKDFRGKLSRTLAGKIAIAAKTDYYKGEFIGNKLKEEFQGRVKSLVEQSKKNF